MMAAGKQHLQSEIIADLKYYTRSRCPSEVRVELSILGQMGAGLFTSRSIWCFCVGAEARGRESRVGDFVGKSHEYWLYKTRVTLYEVYIMFRAMCMHYFLYSSQQSYKSGTIVSSIWNTRNLSLGEEK